MMYSKSEILDAIEAANENIKLAKAQIKRLEKVVSLYEEIREENTFGIPYTICSLEVFDMLNAYDKQMESSKANIVKYKKMLKLIDQLEEMSGLNEIEGD